MAALKHFPGDAELEQQGFVGAHKLHAYLLSTQAVHPDGETARRARPPLMASAEGQTSSLGESQPSDTESRASDQERPTPASELQPSDGKGESEGRPLHEMLTQVGGDGF
jgi:hypothetical protein